MIMKQTKNEMSLFIDAVEKYFTQVKTLKGALTCQRQNGLRTYPVWAI